MYKNLLSVALLFLLSQLVFAQNGKITGRVVDDKNAPIIGAYTQIPASGLKTVTDVEGRFIFKVAAGQKYSVQVSAMSYVAKTINDIEVKADGQEDIVITLAQNVSNLKEVNITTTYRKESINSLISFQKNTNAVAQVVSAEAIRRSPDKNTSEVLKRIPGTSVQEGKYLVVRGLADRYNQAMLNGVLLSSTEPDRKTFSFDLFPSNMIDNIIINNTFIPEYPGEWAGGLVQVNTKDIPNNKFLNIQIGTNFNSNTIGNDFYSYKGGKTDWLGFDDGTRALPKGMPTKSVFAGLSEADKINYGKQMAGNAFSVNKNTNPLARLGQQFLISGGTRTTIFNKEFGAVFAVNYNRSIRRLQYDNGFYVINGMSAPPSFEYQNNKYSTDILEGAMANFSLKLNQNNKISLKNIFNVTTSDYTNLRVGKDYEAQPTDNIRARELGFRANTFFNTVLSGEHNLPTYKLKLDWYGSFNILDQYIPMQRRIQYNQTTETKDAPYLALLSNTLSQKSGSIYYSTLSDYIYTAGGNLTKSFQLWDRKQSIKGGYMLQIKDRLFDGRPFAVNLPSDNLALRMQDEDHIFAPENFGTADNQLGFNETVGIQYRYLANSILNAGYIQFDNSFTDWLRVVWGVRYENFDQLVGSTRKSDERFNHTQVGDFLPSVNATFKLNDKTNIRVAESQTLVRPEFRELTNLAFYDFEMGAIITGSKTLQRTKITNLDARYEYYPRPGEVITFGLFYKDFKNPIELKFNQSGVNSYAFNYVNALSAKSYGVELEVRKKLDFVDESLKNVSFQGNASYIYNRVNFENKQQDRPMQGQSPYLINAGFLYDAEKIGLTSTILFNQIGRRILFVGNDQNPAIWEAPRPLLDLQIAKKILNSKGEIKLNITDLINQNANFYQDLDDNKRFSKSKDVLALRRTYGTNFSLIFGYNF
ncbi:TonB-dependent receptor [Chitinophaga defluvii]|uniref:TonB-dependent receptor n=1 Tax=Chitinophaga defluvii TaxID=3163343 RepID=A0ABV2T474_9BACT